MRVTQKHVFVLLGLLVLIGGGVAVSKVTRGWRNSNPGNIRDNINFMWDGQTGADDDGFAKFEEPKWGVRAMAKIYKSYRRGGYISVQDIIARYAPSTENHTENYVKYVTNRTGWTPNTIVQDTVQDYATLAEAMIMFENARINLMTEQEIREAVALA